MATAPFGVPLETSLKQPAQGGKLHMGLGITISPEFFCCISGSSVGVAKDPVAHLVLSATRVCTGVPITATYSGSWSPSSTINSWEVNWGDGNISTGAWPGAGSVAHPGGGYLIPATYTVTLTVTDLLGAVGDQSISVEAIDCDFIPILLLGGCGSSGPWFTESAGIDWDAIGAGDLDGVLIYDLKVTPWSLISDQVVIWVASENGLYRGTYTISSGETVWVLLAPDAPLGYDVVPNIVSVCPSKYSVSEIYFLAHDNDNNQVWLYRSTDDGATWTHIQLGNDGGWIDLNGGVNNDVLTLKWGALRYMYAGGWCWFPTGVWPFNRWGKWDGTSWNPTGDGVEDAVNDQTRDDLNNIYAAGAFDDGVNHLVAKYNGITRTYLPASPNVNEIMCIEWQSSTSYLWMGGIAGGGGPQNAVYYYDIFGGWTWPASPAQFTGNLGSGTTTVYDIAVDGNNVYVCGNFSAVGAVAARGVAHWDGVAWNVMGAGVVGTNVPRSICVDSDHNVYIGGANWTIGGGPAYSKVGKWDGVGWTPVGTAASRISTGTVYSLTVDDNDVLYAGGSFTNYLLYWDDTTSTWEQVTNPGPNDTVRTVTFDYTGNLWIGGEFTTVDGILVNYVAEYLANGGKLPEVGWTHLLDMSADGQYVYVGMLNLSDDPQIWCVSYDLVDYDAVIDPADGTWGGVVADPYYANVVWAFGDFGAEKVQISEDWGETWIDVTDGSWGGSELVRPLLISYWDVYDIVAILNDALESWQSKDSGNTWGKKGDTAFVAGCGCRDPWEPLNIWIGRAGAGANHIQYSPNEGANWIEHSGGFTANAPCTALMVIG